MTFKFFLSFYSVLCTTQASDDKKTKIPAFRELVKCRYQHTFSVKSYRVSILGFAGLKFSGNYPALLLYKSNLRYYVNEWVWLCSIKYYSQNLWPAHGPQFADLYSGDLIALHSLQNTFLHIPFATALCGRHIHDFIQVKTLNFQR